MSWLGGMPDYAAIAAASKPTAEVNGNGKGKETASDDAMKVDEETKVREKVEEMKVDDTEGEDVKKLKEGDKTWLDLLNVLRDVTESKVDLTAPLFCTRLCLRA